MTIGYLYAKLFGRLHGKCIINSQLDHDVDIDINCNIVECKIGRHSYIAHDSQVVNTEIGFFCSISDHVSIGGAEHPMDWVSTSPVFQNVRHSGPKTRYAKHELPQLPRTKIGSDVWIGHNVTIKAGVNIGHGAVIGSGAVVTKDVPPYAIVAGVPAKLLKYRFDDKTINLLLETKWWEAPADVLGAIGKYVIEPIEFCKMLKKNLNLVARGGKL